MNINEEFLDKRDEKKFIEMAINGFNLEIMKLTNEIRQDYKNLFETEKISQIMKDIEQNRKKINRNLEKENNITVFADTIKKILLLSVLAGITLLPAKVIVLLFLSLFSLISFTKVTIRLVFRKRNTCLFNTSSKLNNILNTEKEKQEIGRSINLKAKELMLNNLYEEARYKYSLLAFINSEISEMERIRESECLDDEKVKTKGI
jgi:hypothetical protein